MKTIIHHVMIKAPAGAVHEAITTPEGLARWWTPRVSKEGDVIKFHFDENMRPHMKVKKNNDTHVTWQCISGHDNWQDDTFTFDLHEADGVTHLMFRQHYTIEHPDEVFGMYNFVWGNYMDSLREYCETGIGKPFQG
ncbi:MAG: SRPBCC domain-containing protein [Chloroflexi bacterium]|nr:SRPBCC domain-containing protein [Chloroflexota bacterium]